MRSDKLLTESYISDISQICNMKAEDVKKVFQVYYLYMLHLIATREDEEKAEITLPFFSSMVITPSKKSKKGVQISIPSSRSIKFRDDFEKAFYKRRDSLDNYLDINFSKDLYNDFINILEEHS